MHSYLVDEPEVTCTSRHPCRSLVLLTPEMIPIKFGVGTVTGIVCNTEVVVTVTSMGSAPPQKTRKIISFPTGSKKFAIPDELKVAQTISSPIGPADGVLKLNPALPFIQWSAVLACSFTLMLPTVKFFVIEVELTVVTSPPRR